MGINLFVISVLVISISAILIYVKNPIVYFKSKEGKGVLFGVVVVIAVAFSIALIAAKANSLEFFGGGDIFVGLDSTRKISPMCDPGVNSDKLTSNVGLRADLLSSDDKKTNVNIKYTHHSCAFNPDAKSYDAVGVEVVYKLW